MTVISALITKHDTAHASDSFITKAKRNGGVEVINSRQTKLVYVKRWRGVLAYWGLAQFKKWSTLEWLRERARIAGTFPNPEEFANAVAVDLDRELAKLSISKPSDKGIGIHFTAYERLDDRWIPELFLISNWEGIPYTKIRSTGVGASRETYHTKKVTSASCSKFPRTPAILDDGPSFPVCSMDLDNCTLLGVELLHGNDGIHPGTSIRRCEFAASHSS